MRLPVTQESKKINVDKLCYKITFVTMIFCGIGFLIILGIWIGAILNSW